MQANELGGRAIACDPRLIRGSIILDQVGPHFYGLTCMRVGRWNMMSDFGASVLATVDSLHASLVCNIFALSGNK